MENGQGSSQPNGSTVMSQSAGEGSGGDRNDENKPGIASNLKSYGVDTDQMKGVAEERVTELQQLVIDEIRARPFRALGWAAAAGVIFGVWAAR